MMRAWLTVVCLCTLWRPSLAQPLSVPVTTSSTVTWFQSDGTTIAEAQGFSLRVRVDGSPTVFAVTGGTCAPTTITDATGATWSLGPGTAPTIAVVRNGLVVGTGSQLAVVLGTIYHLTDKWYRWEGTDWGYVLATDPPPATLLAAALSRWTCQARLSPALVVVLNGAGDHAVVARLYDPATKLESIDSVPLIWTTTPGRGTAPTVRVVAVVNPA